MDDKLVVYSWRDVCCLLPGIPTILQLPPLLFPCKHAFAVDQFSLSRSLAPSLVPFPAVSLVLLPSYGAHSLAQLRRTFTAWGAQRDTARRIRTARSSIVHPHTLSVCLCSKPPPPLFQGLMTPRVTAQEQQVMDPCDIAI